MVRGVTDVIFSNIEHRDHLNYYQSIVNSLMRHGNKERNNKAWKDAIALKFEVSQSRTAHTLKTA